MIGGAVSIDIFNKGNDKSQVLKKLFGDTANDYNIIFVGDRITYPGNDHSLAAALNGLRNAKAIEVHSWEDTRALLKTKLFASG